MDDLMRLCDVHGIGILFRDLKHIRAAAVVLEIDANLPATPSAADLSSGEEVRCIKGVCDFERWVLRPLQEQIDAALQLGDVKVPLDAPLGDHYAHGDLFLVRVGSRMVVVRALNASVAAAIAIARDKGMSP